MADKDHVKALKQGPDRFSEWRLTHPEVRLDLEGADLRRAKLFEVDLRSANFRGASLELADFRWADLQGCDFTGARLARADFHKADLTNAKLTKADLKLTNFEDANLTSADLAFAIFSHTKLRNTDLSNATGLEQASHPTPSELDQETISIRTDLPVAFLKGCGLSDREVASAIKGLVSAEVFSDFLDMASYLLEQGYKDAAAVMIGSVLEEHLRQLCQSNSIDTFDTKNGRKIPKGGNMLNQSLRRANAYNQIDGRSIEFWFDIRNQAAHGNYGQYSRQQVELMLRGVLEFLARIKHQLI